MQFERFYVFISSKSISVKLYNYKDNPRFVSAREMFIFRMLQEEECIVSNGWKNAENTAVSISDLFPLAPVTTPCATTAKPPQPLPPAVPSPNTAVPRFVGTGLGVAIAPGLRRFLHEVLRGTEPPAGRFGAGRAEEEGLKWLAERHKSGTTGSHD